MAYNTNNPLGSNDFRDLSDNTVNFDYFANGSEPSYPNRFNQLKLSISGMNEQFNNSQAGRAAQFEAALASIGFSPIGDYGAGVTFTTRQQYVVRAGLAYTVANDTTLPYTLTGTWATDEPKLKLISSDQLLRSDLASSTSGMGADLVRYADKAVMAAQEGCISGTDITDAFEAARDKADALQVPLVMSGVANGILSRAVELPQLFDGRGCVFTGDIIVRARKHALSVDFSCTNLLTEGVWHSRLANVNVSNTWTVGGYLPVWGTFYNSFHDIRCANQIILDVRQQAINGNAFHNCLGNGTGVPGLRITDFGATSSGGIMEAHANTFYNCDFSHSTGCLNDIIVRNQTNYLVGCYFEHGALPYGNWTIGGAGLALDGNYLPSVTEYDHVLNMANISAPTWGDSLSATAQNICPGGDWSSYSDTAIPPGFTASYAATAVGTSGAPYGFSGMYGGSVTGTNQSLHVNFNSPTGKFSAVVWIYSGTGVAPDNLYIDDGATQSFRSPTARYNYGGGWYLYRVSGAVTANAASKIVFLVNGSGGGTKEMYIGAAYVTPSKASFFPTFREPSTCSTVFMNGVEFKKGIKGVPYTATAPSADITVTYGSAFRSSLAGIPSFTVKPASGYFGRVTSIDLVSYSSSGFTVRIFFPSDFAGDLVWSAISN